jgi:hypothetical protein
MVMTKQERKAQERAKAAAKVETVAAKVETATQAPQGATQAETGEDSGTVAQAGAENTAAPQGTTNSPESTLTPEEQVEVNKAAQAAVVEDAQAKAVAEKQAEEDAAKAKRAEDDLRAEQETLRVAQEHEVSRQQQRAESDAKAAAASADTVVVTVPKAFRLNIDNHKSYTYPAGTYPMPRVHAEHWYVRAQGAVPAQSLVDAINPMAAAVAGRYTNPRTKAIADAINALPGRFPTADAAIGGLRASFGNEFSEEHEAMVRAKFG